MRSSALYAVGGALVSVVGLTGGRAALRSVSLAAGQTGLLLSLR